MEPRKKFDLLAIDSLTEEDCPPAEQIAAYILGTLSDTTQLAIAAHVRRCPLCWSDVVTCQPPALRPRLRIARLLAPTPVFGLRSPDVDSHIRRYIAADLTIDVLIAPLDGERWRLSGHLLRAGELLGGHELSLQRGRRRYRQRSDEEGFFSFEGIPAGRYTLNTDSDDSRIQLRGLLVGRDQ